MELLEQTGAWEVVRQEAPWPKTTDLSLDMMSADIPGSEWEMTL